MRKLAMLTLISGALSLMPAAQAGSATLTLGKLRGQIQPQGELAITQARVILDCGFCTASTCAGGPHASADVPTAYRPNPDGRSLSIQTSPATLRASKVFNKLNGCGIYLDLRGRNLANGSIVEGSVTLAHSSGQDPHPFWKDPALTQSLQSLLNAKPVRVEIEKVPFGGPSVITSVNW